MKKSRFTEKRIEETRREADSGSVAGVARWRKVSEQTIYKWHKKLGEFDHSGIRRLRFLEAENVMLRRMVGELEMAIEALKEINHYRKRRIRKVL